MNKLELENKKQNLLKVLDSQQIDIAATKTELATTTEKQSTLQVQFDNLTSTELRNREQVKALLTSISELNVDLMYLARLANSIQDESVVTLEEIAAVDADLLEIKRQAYINQTKKAIKDYDKAVAEMKSRLEDIQVIASNAFSAGCPITSSSPDLRLSSTKNPPVYTMFDGKIQQDVAKSVLLYQRGLEEAL